jgi:peroxiredoxin
LAQDDVLTDDTLREFVILKNLYDEFYKDQFSRSSMLDILDTLILVSPVSRHREIGRTIKDKVTKLLVGHAPPAFSLYNRDSTLVSLSDFEGQYVYLNFCICLTYSCIKEFEQLKILNEQHGDKLKIVTIAFDEKFSSMVNFLKKNDYNWTFLYYGNQPDIMKKYDIRAYPTYYLVGPDGKLVASPAPSPAENFEYFLFKIMKSKGDI